jgi:quercetin dioxygenase-like cupin family protein
MSGRVPKFGRWRYALGAAAVAAVATAAVSLPSAAVVTSSRQSASLATHDHHAQENDDIVFGPAPPVFPAGAEMAVLQGDPSVPGAIFTVRLRLPNGYVLPPHTHPTDEHVTVISGTFLVGLGDVFDKSAFLPALHRGRFVTAPAHASHFAKAKGRTVVQVHAIGPFQLDYVNPADDPRTRL